LELARAIYYSLQKDLSNGVFYAQIGVHLTFNLKGFVVGSQIPNLILDPPFDHNPCISNLNKQLKGILSIYISSPFQWYFKGPKLVFVYSFN
jgi:hypothetical protein